MTDEIKSPPRKPITFVFTIEKQYHVEDGYDFDSAKNQFINDVANGNFRIEDEFIHQ